MNTIPTTGRSLPHWVNEPSNWYAQSRPHWLQAVHSARLSTLRRCLYGGAARTAAGIGPAVDELVGLLLMQSFAQQRTSIALPSFRDLPIDGIQTMRSACNHFRGHLASPLLQSVFDPAMVADLSEIPIDAIPGNVDELAWLGGQHFPVTAFGDYHQLCLAKPLLNVPEADAVDERRARGVHFTPSPLVDYLTDSMLSRLLNESDTRDGQNLRILDPSCGNGVFLIAAMRFLTKRIREGGPALIQETLDQIASNLFGTDINPRAVEWARRSLLLAVWESDSDGDHSRLQVPDLRRNLVAADFLAATSPAEFPNEFDAILGGPPFVRYSQLKKDCPQQVEEWRTRFVTARTRQFDLYMPFFEYAVRRLKPGGRLGWSISNTFLRSKFGAPLREFLGRSCTTQELIEFENPKVYADAVTQIVLVQLKKHIADESCRHVWICGKPDLRHALNAVAGEQSDNGIELQVRLLPATACRGREWRLNNENDLAHAMSQTDSRTLKELGIRITQGLVTGADPVFLLRVVHAGQSGLTRVEDREGRQHLIDSALLQPAVRSREIRGYADPRTKSHLLLPYDTKGRVFSEQELELKFPAAHRYLSKRKCEIPATGKHNQPYYAFRNDAVLRLPPGPRVLAGMVTSGADATLDSSGVACPHAGVLIVSNFPTELDPLYLLAIINSPVFWSFVRATMPTMGEGRHVLRRGPLANFRIAVPLSSIQAEIAAMVRQLMEAAIDGERTPLKGAINEAVVASFGRYSNAEPEMSGAPVDQKPSGEIGAVSASLSETRQAVEPTETT